MNREDISHIMSNPYRGRSSYLGYAHIHLGVVFILKDYTQYWAWLFIIIGAYFFCKHRFSILLFRANKNLKLILLTLLAANVVIIHFAFKYGLEDGLAVPFVFYILFGLLFMSEWENNISKKYGC